MGVVNMDMCNSMLVAQVLPLHLLCRKATLQTNYQGLHQKALLLRGKHHAVGRPDNKPLLSHWVRATHGVLELSPYQMKVL
jgi:hypothetical protein